MTRTPRMAVPGQALHIIQRDNNRQPVFFREDDHRIYLEALQGAARSHGCASHAYVLITNRVHLLVTPEQPEGPSRMMQALGRTYVRFVNGHYRRTGTLWEGRFKSALIHSERYLLACGSDVGKRFCKPCQAAQDLSCFFFQQSLHILRQGWQLRLEDAPDESIIDLCVAVNQDISECDNAVMFADQGSGRFEFFKCDKKVKVTGIRIKLPGGRGAKQLQSPDTVSATQLFHLIMMSGNWSHHGLDCMRTL